MLFNMSFSRFFGVMPSVCGVSTCGVCVMCCFFVMATFVVFCSFLMVARGMRMVL
jgi:hypothetical protein